MNRQSISHPTARPHRRPWTVILVALVMVLATGRPAAASPFDPPEIAFGLTGEVQGKVLWAHESGTWFMFDAEVITPDDEPAEKYDELLTLEKGLRVQIPWKGPGEPRPEFKAFVEALEAGQVLTLRVRPGVDGKSLRLDKLPKVEAEEEAEEEPAPAKPIAAPPEKPTFVMPPIPDVQPPLESVDVSGVTGAVIDESVVEVALHVAADAEPGGDGTEAQPFTGLSAALSAATAHLDRGEPVRILLAAGIYREAIGDIEFETDAARQTTLIIEGNTAEGDVVFSGADRFTQWRDEGDGLWSHDWPHDFGFFAGMMGKQNIMGLLGQRQEMIFVDDQWMHPVILEDHSYGLDTTGPIIKKKGQHGGGGFADKTGSWEYLGFREPAEVLTPGTFGVAEMDENGNRIFLRLDAGLNPNDADTQVTTRGKFARFYPKDNLVFRGITIERFGHNILSGPRWRQTGCVLQFGVPGVKPFFHMHDVLVEDVTLRWNSGGGASFHSTQGLTVRELESLHNGGGGNVLGSVQNMLWEDVTTNFNNWRGALGHKRGWAIGGTKFHVFRDAIIRRHTALGNEMIGIWMDVNCENFLVEDAISIDNTSGIFLEISKGPMEVRGGLFADNDRSAIKLLCAEHVTLRDNIFVMSSGQQRSGTGYDENIGRNTQKAAAAVEYLFYNRSSVKSTAQWDVFGTELFGKPKTHTVYALPGPVLAEGNVIVAGEQRFVMSMSAWLPPERRSPETIGGAWTGAGNVYFGADENSFLFTDIEVPGESPDHKKQLGLSSWSQRFEESESTFVDPQFADAGNFDFTVSSDSPLAERADELPLIRLDPGTVAEIRAWQQFLADLRPHEPAP